MSAVIHIYKARARSNGYRMFISVYILWFRKVARWLSGRELEIVGLRG